MARIMFAIGVLLAAVSVTYAQDVSFSYPIYSTDTGADLIMTCLMKTGHTLDGFYVPDKTKAASGGRILVTEGTVPAAGVTSHTLQITAVAETDHGLYECRSKEGGSATVTLEIRVTIPEAAPAQSIAIGDDGVVEVRVTGFPRPRKMEWGKESTPGVYDFIASRLRNGDITGSARYTIAEHGSLTIKGVLSSDAGKYRISVATATGFLNKVIALTVGEKPKFAKKPNATYSVTKGETLDIPCELTGALANPVWTQNKTDGTTGAVATVGRISVRPTLLEISAAEQSDEGEYMCSASNEFGTASATAVLLHVIDPPTVTILSVDSLIEGQKSNLTCNGTGRPAPAILWEKLTDDAFVAVAGQQRVPGSSVVLLAPVKQSDRGLYRCTADNGAVIAGVAKTDAKNQSYVVNSPPKATVVDRMLSFIVASKENRTINCTATGFPAPTITFLFNNTALPNTPVELKDPAKPAMIISSIVYIVTDESQLGTVVCLAKNAYGNATAEVQIMAISPPAAPTSLSTESVTNSSFVLKWQAPPAGASAPSGYLVTVSIGDKSIRNITTMTTMVEVKGLENGTFYKLAVRAKNAAGFGPLSLFLTAETLKLVKPNKPILEDSKTDLPATTLELKWDAPVGSPMSVEYLITLCKYNIIEDLYNVCDKATVQTELTWKRTDLEPNTKYKVSVNAQNAQGTSESVSKEFQTGPDPKKGAKKSGLSSGAVVGIIIVILLIIFIIVDLCCCFFNNCGFSHCCFESCCSGRKGKYAAAEVGEEVMMDRKGAV